MTQLLIDYYFQFGFFNMGILFAMHILKGGKPSIKATMFIVPSCVAWPLYIPYLWKNFL